MNILEMIEHYGMVRNGDKIRMSKNLDEARKNIAAIQAAKPQILAYWDQLAEDENHKDAIFYSIPGVRELADARAEWSQWQRDFNAAMDREDGIVPRRPQSDIQSLEQNQLAVWALRVKREALYSENYEISSIGKRAYEALRDGENPEAVKETYDAEMQAFAERHQFD